jgi:hypothetical protein
MMPILFLLGTQAGDTLTIRAIPTPPIASAPVDSAHLGSPQLRFRTGQGTALIWLLRSADTVFVAASIPDTTHYWGDDFVLSLDTRGDGGPSPQHDDFQWYFRRVLDSSGLSGTKWPMGAATGRPRLAARAGPLRWRLGGECAR